MSRLYSEAGRATPCQYWPVLVCRQFYWDLKFEYPYNLTVQKLNLSNSPVRFLLLLFEGSLYVTVPFGTNSRHYPPNLYCLSISISVSSFSSGGGYPSTLLRQNSFDNTIQPLINFKYNQVGDTMQSTVSQQCGLNNPCPSMYNCVDGQCIHTLLQFSLPEIIGIISIALISGVSTMAGLGGGGPMVAILLVVYNYSPKRSTLLVYALILGGSLGNVINQATTSIKGKTTIKFRYAFVIIPFMFMGSLFGVIINKFFPSLVVCFLILITAATSLPSIYKRFRISYDKETTANEASKGVQQRDSDHEVKRFNPFKDQENLYIIKKLILLIVGFGVLQLLRGSQKFDSIVGIKRCSGMYWVLEICLLVFVGVQGWLNIKTMTEWESKDHMILLQDRQTIKKISFWQKSREIVKYSFYGGIFNGLGLGGGLFLMPMIRELGLDPLQTSSTVSFCICVVALNNTIQALLMGAVTFSELAYFVPITVCGSFFISKYLSVELRLRNRLSLVELALVILIMISLVNIPYGLIEKYVRSGYDSSLVLGFGTVC